MQIHCLCRSIHGNRSTWNPRRPGKTHARTVWNGTIFKYCSVDGFVEYVFSQILCVCSHFTQGMSGPIFGLCPGSRDWIRESSGNPLTGKDWIRAPPEASKHLDDTDAVMTQLAMKKIEAFSSIGHGFFFWNFRSESPYHILPFAFSSCRITDFFYSILIFFILSSRSLRTSVVVHG